MKLIFDWPSKLHISECSYTFEAIEFNSLKIIVFPKKNVYYNSKLGKIAYRRIQQNSYFINMFDDYISYLGTEDNFDIIQARLENLGKIAIQKFIDDTKHKIDFIDLVNEEKQKIIEEKIKLKENYKEQKQQEELNRIAQEKNQLVEAKEQFITGVYITPLLFEKLCKQNDILIPIKTIGAIRKHITSISTENVVCYKNVNSIWNYIKALKSSIEETIEYQNYTQEDIKEIN